MKIFHGITEIAGQMSILCGVLKQKGHIATGYNTFHSYLGYQDHLINTDLLQLQKMFKHILNFHNIFHYHYGVTIWPDFRDLEHIRKKGKKVIMQHWGNDVRFHDLARKNNPFVYTGDSPPNNLIHQNLSKISTYISEAIVQDQEVLPYVAPYYKKVHILPIAIDLRNFQPAYPAIEKKRPLIIHAPTNPDFKGTACIESAIDKLRSSHKFDYRRIEKLNHSQAIKLYREADIVIDQVRCGSHGLLSVESMALGKPVITFIRPDLTNTFSGNLPIVNGNPDNLTDKIKMLLEDPILRNTLGVQGRMYAWKHHSKNVIVKKLLKIYANLT